MSSKSIDRWDCIKVVCIKEYKTLRVGSHYQVKGRGNLEYNNDDEVNGRTGWGMCIEDYGDWDLPYKDRVKWYYFTLDELNEYFISDEEDFKIYQRNQKLNEILDGNR